MNKMVNARIAETCQIAKGIYKMKLICPEAAQNAAAGRFVNVYPKSKETLLPRPISISEVNADGLTLVLSAAGKGTREFAAYEKGDDVRISTPLGNGFDLMAMAFSETEKRVKNIFLFGGGIGAAPLPQLAKDLKAAGYARVFAVLGFKEEPFLTAELKEAGANVITALESEGQNVLDKYIEENPENRGGFQGKEGFQSEVGFEADYALACGPKPMLKALAAYFEKKNVPLQVSMEERMGCGYGACVGCVCRTTEGLKKVCSDGPVFIAREVKWDE